MASNTETILLQTEDFVKQSLAGDSSGHDWWHIYRVWQTAKTIAREEGANLFICELAALLHDVADEKLNPSKEVGLQKVSDFLATINIGDNDSAHIIDIIANLSFRGGANPPMRTLEGRVVQDADRLDAIGAMGISRVFAYAGAKGGLIHDPSLPPRTELTPEQYRGGQSTAINHFYEKLLTLKERMNTRYGKAMAEERHRFMETYLQQFYQEWEGNK